MIMASSSHLPSRTKLPGGAVISRFVGGSLDGTYAIHACAGGGRALVVDPEWAARLAPEIQLAEHCQPFEYHGRRLLVLTVQPETLLDRVDHISPQSLARTLSFATVLGRYADLPAFREAANAIYVEEAGLLVPVSHGHDDKSISDKAMVLGRHLTGGVEISAEEIDKLEQIALHSGTDVLLKILAAAGVKPKELTQSDKAAGVTSSRLPPNALEGEKKPFALAGRPALSAFFNEHVIDIIENQARYEALGIGFPGGIILEGPTGCGKTFAVEKLVEYLNWPSFSVDASSVASPYIHETSKKVAEVFNQAMKVSPSVITIDEMDAFLADRDIGTGHHRVEEVAEFLRRIPEAATNRVLVIGMTNKIDMIDPAILRRGRFDHVIRVDPASKEEILGLLESLLEAIPNDIEDRDQLAAALAGRPLSDVAFVVREAGRLTVRAGRDRIGPDEMAAAVKRSAPREDETRQRIGF